MGKGKHVEGNPMPSPLGKHPLRTSWHESQAASMAGLQSAPSSVLVLWATELTFSYRHMKGDKFSITLGQEVCVSFMVPYKQFEQPYT